MLTLLTLLLVAAGCAKQIIPVSIPPSKPEPKPGTADLPPPRPSVLKPPPAPPPSPAPRQVAARNMTREGVGLLSRGEAAAAIDALEQSLILDARNGETYYYLAEAWIAQGNRDQARQFHNQARTYLEGRGGWATKLSRQAAQLGY
ncbi:MAG: tetratricopeptide repeat protein [Desulfobacterales bacterium]